MATPEAPLLPAPEAAEAPAVPRVLEHREIGRYLRQRSPFLLVDRILSVDAESAVGVKNVSATDRGMEGHFPDDPIYPGVLLVEAMSQVGGVLLAHDPQYRQSTEGYLAALDKVKFTHFVRPGDQVVITATKIRAFGPYARVAVKGTVEGKEVARGEVSYYIR
jgi:3-hydroxyacyl-[acyl-carrier-protein] dehydratase